MIATISRSLKPPVGRIRTRVSLPVLKYSEVLTDDDLIEIVRGENAAAKQVAIAQRVTVSTAVADALIDTGNETAVARLVANEGAELTEEALGRVMADYNESEVVSDSISRRPSLPRRPSQRPNPVRPAAAAAAPAVNPPHPSAAAAPAGPRPAPALPKPTAVVAAHRSTATARRTSPARSARRATRSSRRISRTR